MSEHPLTKQSICEIFHFFMWTAYEWCAVVLGGKDLWEPEASSEVLAAVD